MYLRGTLYTWELHESFKMDRFSAFRLEERSKQDPTAGISRARTQISLERRDAQGRLGGASVVEGYVGRRSAVSNRFPHNHNCFFNTFVTLLPFVLGAAQIDGDVDLGVNVGSEMSYVVADEASSASAVESAAATVTIICVNEDCRSELTQYDDRWELIINCGGDDHRYSGPGQYDGTLCGVSP